MRPPLPDSQIYFPPRRWPTLTGNRGRRRARAPGRPRPIPPHPPRRRGRPCETICVRPNSEVCALASGQGSRPGQAPWSGQPGRSSNRWKGLALHHRYRLGIKLPALTSLTLATPLGSKRTTFVLIHKTASTDGPPMVGTTTKESTLFFQPPLCPMPAAAALVGTISTIPALRAAAATPTEPDAALLAPPSPLAVPTSLHRRLPRVSGAAGGRVAQVDAWRGLVGGVVPLLAAVVTLTMGEPGAGWGGGRIKPVGDRRFASGDVAVRGARLLPARVPDCRCVAASNPTRWAAGPSLYLF